MDQLNIRLNSNRRNIRCLYKLVNGTATAQTTTHKYDNEIVESLNRAIVLTNDRITQLENEVEYAVKYMLEGHARIDANFAEIANNLRIGEPYIGGEKVHSAHFRASEAIDNFLDPVMHRTSSVSTNISAPTSTSAKFKSLTKEHIIERLEKLEKQYKSRKFNDIITIGNVVANSFQYLDRPFYSTITATVFPGMNEIPSVDARMAIISIMVKIECHVATNDAIYTTARSLTTPWSGGNPTYSLIRSKSKKFTYTVNDIEKQWDDPVYPTKKILDGCMVIPSPPMTVSVGHAEGAQIDYLYPFIVPEDEGLPQLVDGKPADAKLIEGVDWTAIRVGTRWRIDFRWTLPAEIIITFGF